MLEHSYDDRVNNKRNNATLLIFII